MSLCCGYLGSCYIQVLLCNGHHVGTMHANNERIHIFHHQASTLMYQSCTRLHIIESPPRHLGHTNLIYVVLARLTQILAISLNNGSLRRLVPVLVWESPGIRL